MLECAIKISDFFVRTQTSSQFIPRCSIPTNEFHLRVQKEEHIFCPGFNYTMLRQVIVATINPHSHADQYEEKKPQQNSEPIYAY